MNQKYTIFSILLLCVSLTLKGQNSTEIQTIVSASNTTQNSILKSNLETDAYEKQQRINEFLSNNTEIQKNKYENDRKFTIVDIIDNTPIYITTDNADAAEATRANFMHTGGGLGLNIEGQGMTVGVWDGENVLFNHQEFYYSTFGNPGTRVTTPDYEVAQSYGSHGTHVAGTIMSKGVQSQAKGMAPRALVVSYEWDSDITEVLSEVTTNGLLISNHSYGVPVEVDGEPYAPTWMMGCYDSNAASWDALHYNNPYYLQVASAGNNGSYSYPEATNDGYDKLTQEKNAKNNLVVANALDPQISVSGELQSININPSSSQGPTDDARIKPDITGNGTGVYSPTSDSVSSYGNYTGTSMAAPNVAGSLILLQQYYNDINNSFMKSATLKALVCHTADDDGTRIGPDPIYGWGLLNVKTSAETILNASQGNAVIFEGTLDDGETYTTTFSASSNGPISATICWTDPAGTSQNGTLNSTIPALVNDLDLLVTAPDGSTTYQPWKLMTFSPTSSAITGDNFVDTVENIDIDSPNSGTYTITVDHKNSLTNGFQDFSLIVTGSNLTLGTSNAEISALHVWPNPAQTEINFEYPSSNGPTTISLVDIQGRIVYQNTRSYEAGRIRGTIDSSNMARGLYILNVKQGNFSTHKKVFLR